MALLAEEDPAERLLALLGRRPVSPLKRPGAPSNSPCFSDDFGEAGLPPTPPFAPFGLFGPFGRGGAGLSPGPSLPLGGAADDEGAPAFAIDGGSEGAPGFAGSTETEWAPGFAEWAAHWQEGCGGSPDEGAAGPTAQGRDPSPKHQPTLPFAAKRGQPARQRWRKTSEKKARRVRLSTRRAPARR